MRTGNVSKDVSVDGEAYNSRGFSYLEDVSRSFLRNGDIYNLTGRHHITMDMNM
jgi:hypothetical protein